VSLGELCDAPSVLNMVPLWFVGGLSLRAATPAQLHGLRLQWRLRLSTVGAWKQHVWNLPVVMVSWVKVRLVLPAQRASPYGEVLCFVVPVAVYYSAIFIIPNVSYPADHPDTS